MEEVSIQEILKKMLEKEVYVEELSGISVYGYLMAFDDRFLILSQAEIFGRRAKVIVDTIFINKEYVGSICAGVEGITVSRLKKGKVIMLPDLVKAQAKVTVQTKRGEMVEGTIIGVLNDGVCLYKASVKGIRNYRSRLHLIFFNNIAHINTEVISIVPSNKTSSKKSR